MPYLVLIDLDKLEIDVLKEILALKIINLLNV
jgi:hypothetical protein